MTSSYNKKEKLVLPQKLRFDLQISSQYNLVYQKTNSNGPSAHFRCSDFPYRPKKSHVFTFFVGFVRPCYVKIRVTQTTLAVLRSLCGLASGGSERMLGMRGRGHCMNKTNQTFHELNIVFFMM